MFEVLTKSKFFNKCKSAARRTKTRLEFIKRKRNAMQKYLKNDIVDLLKNGLDNNAYGRAEGFLVEQNLTSCYEFVEKFCVQILNNVSVMDTQRECPKDCREAISSLIFAAARFADLPDLRHLRSIFTIRYGTSIESYVNKEFEDKLKLVPPTKDMKLQLMQDIAHESGVKWDRNAAEDKLFNHLPQHFKQAKNNVTDDEFQVHRNADDSPKMKYTKYSLSPKIIEQNPEERNPFRNFPRERKKEVGEENVEDKEITQHKPIPPPPYRRSYVEQTIDDYEGLIERDNKKLTDNPVRRHSKPKPVSVRRRRSKLVFDDKDVGVSSAGKDAESLKKVQDFTYNQYDDEEETVIDKLLMKYSNKKSPLGIWEAESNSRSVHMRHGSYDIGSSKTESPFVEQQETKKKHHIRSSSSQTETKKLPDYYW